MQQILQRFSALLWNKDDFIHNHYMPNQSFSLDDLIPGDAPRTLCWPDICYADQSRGEWSAAQHYLRVQRILQINGPQRYSDDLAYREKILAAFRYWLHHDFVNPNPWYNEIGTPRTIADICIMTWEYLPASDRIRALELLARGSVKNRPDILNWTGANLIWGVTNTIKHALLLGNADLLGVAADRAAAEMHFAFEGIQEDGAFCQHGKLRKRWYSGGYGASFTFDVAVLVHALHGSAWAFPRKALDVFLLHVLDGQRIMMKNGYFDYRGIGREFARPGEIYKRNLITAVKMLARIKDLPRADEIAAFAKENEHPAAVSADTASDKTVFYPSVQLLCHRKNGSYIGIKGHNNTLYDQEQYNDEGVLAYNLSYGTHTCLTRRGDEYFDIAPLWDYAHIPGTTARVENDEQIYAHPDWWRQPGTNSHAGGLTVGEFGILYQKPEHDGISALVSFFTFNGCMVSMGADIWDENPAAGPLTTTVDQCWTKNPTVDNASRPRRVSNGEWTYLNLDDETEFLITQGKRTGSWSRNNRGLPYASVTGDVFTLYIPAHPSHPRFAYMVAPAGGLTGNVRVLCNSGTCQAIHISNTNGTHTVMAVFHADGELALPNGTTIGGTCGKCIILPNLAL